MLEDDNYEDDFFDEFSKYLKFQIANCDHCTAPPNIKDKVGVPKEQQAKRRITKIITRGRRLQTDKPALLCCTVLYCAVLWSLHYCNLAS